MAERDQEIQNIKEKMNNVEDDVFASFCEQIGVSNIRQYEERELRYVYLSFINIISINIYVYFHFILKIVKKIEKIIFNIDSSISNIK